MRGTNFKRIRLVRNVSLYHCGKNEARIKADKMEKEDHPRMKLFPRTFSFECILKRMLKIRALFTAQENRIHISRQKSGVQQNQKMKCKIKRKVNEN